MSSPSPLSSPPAPHPAGPAPSAQPRPPVVRFAPSPTGMLHLGGARTALFNWLFARAQGGRYLLRIEDTDRARSTPQAIDAIVDGLGWLGLGPDEPPLFQSHRAARHAEVAHRLLESGHAYRCWATAEDLAALREQQAAEGRPQGYDRRWRDRAPGSAQAGRPFAIRLKAPLEGSTAIDDRIQGRIEVDNRELDDFVLLRSDGTPTYMLAVVVDDEDMGITHVIRGDDHLANAFRQLALIRALGWREPVYAHLPLIHGPDGAKLSKRHGAVGIAEYRDAGYLPEAMLNALVRLGWAHGDEELLSVDRMIELFSLEGIGRSPARFDPDRLDHINRHWLRAAPPERLAELVAPRMNPRPGHALLVRAMPELARRATTLVDLAESAAWLGAAPRPEGLGLGPDDGKRLKALKDRLGQAEPWSAEALDALLAAEAAALAPPGADRKARGRAMAAVARPARLALTGSAEAPSVGTILALLGREEALARLDAALALALAGAA